MKKVITVSVCLSILAIALLMSNFLDNGHNSANELSVHKSESELSIHTDIDGVVDNETGSQVQVGVTGNLNHDLDVDSIDGERPNGSAALSQDPARVLVEDDFLQFADRLIFHSTDAENNTESKTHVQNSIDQFVTAHHLSGGVYVEYNECNQRTCILSVGILNGMVSQEEFEMLQEELLFGAVSDVSNVGGSFAVIEGDDKKHCVYSMT
ncbi:hypothetical protein [Aliidiomarina celeris]|uniref:hypothetical protein n=1 Tax=Aliidiomarina celeris TaxID=2249428 RepID=UPI000DEB0782|nr:hypothetical protein [Aliidiomarina celeris]